MLESNYQSFHGHKFICTVRCETPPHHPKPMKPQRAATCVACGGVRWRAVACGDVRWRAVACGGWCGGWVKLLKPAGTPHITPYLLPYDSVPLFLFEPFLKRLVGRHQRDEVVAQVGLRTRRARRARAGTHRRAEARRRREGVAAGPGRVTPVQPG